MASVYRGGGSRMGSVRPAVGGDSAVIARMLRLAGARSSFLQQVGVSSSGPDVDGVNGLGVNGLGGAVRAAAEVGRGVAALRGYLEPLVRTGDFALARTACTTVLVATDHDGEVVAVGVAGPAWSVLQDTVGRVDERARRGVLSRGVRTVAELHTIAVAPAHRRRGIGSRLVRDLSLLYTDAGYLEVIGQVPNQPPLVGLAATAGLAVLPAGSARDLTPVMGVPTVACPTSGHRVVHVACG